MGLLTFFKRIFSKKRIRLGLALGSGGAKGAAHLGALKAFEEENIRFDLVAGTSIGSIVGAMYALNYTTDQMIKILEEYNLSDRINILKMTLSKDSLENTLEKILGDKTFSDTLIPLRAVACDVNTGDEVVMGTGSLSKALSASSAIPPVFRPVHRMGRKLVDGAYVNAVPSDVVKSLGADVVISIALHNYSSNRNIKRYADLLYRGNGIKEADRLKQLAYSDYTVFLPLDEYTSADVKNFSEMYQIGYETVKDHMDEIKAVINNHPRHKTKKIPPKKD